MTDLSPTIAAKSDQLGADDLLGGPRTIKITRVTAGSADQPINVYYDGDEGKPWRPCKSMRRVLVSVWGAQGSAYIGRLLTLFRDPTVRWGGIEVGGVRISHMSDIDNDTVLMLTETRGKKAPYKVQKLMPEKRKAPDVDTVLAAIRGAKSPDKVREAHGRAGNYEWSVTERNQIDIARNNALAALVIPEEPSTREPGED